MAIPITELRTPDAFDAGWRLDWSAAPLGVGDHFDVLTCRYALGDGQAVTIDIGGPVVYLSVCRRQGFAGGFIAGDPVLLGDNDAGRMPVHLVFDVPVRAAGARVSVFNAGQWGARYTVQMWARLDGQDHWWPVTDTLRTSQAFDTAPFLGVLARDGQPGIKQVYFDAIGATNTTPLAQQIAINDLLVLDA